jgi:hypothetical protein
MGAVRAVEPSDCRITAYREKIAEREISGLGVILSTSPHGINCANRIVHLHLSARSQTVAVPRAACGSPQRAKEGGRGGCLDRKLPFPCLPDDTTELLPGPTRMNVAMM